MAQQFFYPCINNSMVIYKITNTINGTVYIGQTVQKNPKMRWYGHCADAKCGKNTHLHNSMRKYGIDKFVWEVIEDVDTLELLNEREQYWLELYGGTVNTYNLREAGGNKLHSEKSKLKMSEAQKLAHKRRRENGGDGGWKRVDGGPMKGKAHPKKGKPCKKWSEEAKARLSLVAKERERKKREQREQGNI